MALESWSAKLTWMVCGLLLCACGGGDSTAASSGAAAAADPSPQELQCQSAGWRREVVAAAGLQRLVLWKAPAAWTRGALIVMHGGGGSHTNFCVANVASIAAQVRFTELALAQGFAVFLLDSSDQVSDNEGRVCGKVWDDEVRARANIDLPFVDEVLQRVIPAKRPSGSRSEGLCDRPFIRRIHDGAGGQPLSRTRHSLCSGIERRSLRLVQGLHTAARRSRQCRRSRLRQ